MLLWAIIFQPTPYHGEPPYAHSFIEILECDDSQASMEAVMQRWRELSDDGRRPMQTMYFQRQPPLPWDQKKEEPHA
jgi:hypothetical protein